MRMTKREPRQASGVEELARGEVVKAGHGAGGDGQSSNIEARRDASQGGVGRLEKRREGGDASMGK